MRKIIKNKKGSHVGFVVSFVIFVTFLMFLLAILQPTTIRERNKQYLLDYIGLNLVGNMSSEVTTMLVNVEEPVGPQPCLNLKQIISEGEAGEGEIPEYMINNLLFKTSEETFTYEINSGNIRVNTGNGFQGIITIYYSEEIIPLPYDGNSGCSPKNYPLGFIKTYSEIFESKIYEFNESYNLDYEGLKADLGLPEGTEFAFYLYNGARNEPPIISAEPPDGIPEGVSVYVEEIPIQYIGTDGEIKFGFLVIKIW